MREVEGVKLRQYQEDGVNGIRKCFGEGIKKVLYVLPTGGGKTETFIHIAEKTLAKGKTVFFLVHKKNLVRQISERCNKYNLAHSIIAGGIKPDYECKAQICSVQTLKNRLDKINIRPDLIIVDEAHHSNAGTWKDILNFYNDVYTLGVTATPIRRDGKGLGDIYQEMVLGPSPAALAKMGNLVMPEYYVFKPIKELDNLKKDKFGEYNLNEMVQIMEQNVIIGDIITEYSRLAPGEPAIYSCIDIKHSEKMAQAFRDAGYTAEAIHGEMKDEEVDRIFKGLADRSIQVVTFCNLISEGTDIPAVAVVGLLRKTTSTALYLQIVGRGLRPCPGKTSCLILDHVNNYSNHKHPLIERDWKLEMTKKKQKNKEDEEEDPFTQCKSCYRVFEKKEDCCPYCGAEKEKVIKSVLKKKGVAVKLNVSLDNLLKKGHLDKLWEKKEVKKYKDWWVYHTFCYDVIYYSKDKTIEKVNNQFGINLISLEENDIKLHLMVIWRQFYKDKKKLLKKIL
jgi:superfamily II DNA or RNA helicase